MAFLKQLAGIALMLLGIYFVGKEIIFTTQTYYYWWQKVPATGSVISLLAGLWIIFNARRRDQFLGWIAIGVAIALIFMSGGVILRPVSLWTFLLAFSLLFGGYKLAYPERL